MKVLSSQTNDSGSVLLSSSEGEIIFLLNDLRVVFSRLLFLKAMGDCAVFLLVPKDEFLDRLGLLDWTDPPKVLPSICDTVDGLPNWVKRLEPFVEDSLTSFFAKSCARLDIFKVDPVNALRLGECFFADDSLSEDKLSCFKVSTLVVEDMTDRFAGTEFCFLRGGFFVRFCRK